jgi:hypothetical protein
MSNTIQFITYFVLVLMGLVATAASQTSKPNILVIWATTSVTGMSVTTIAAWWVTGHRTSTGSQVKA